jgi:hypothetical protein
MKKTLIALAVMAASGASFAQVAITGSVAMGYQADTNAASVSTGGFGMDTTALTFTATEDIGGGLKASASLGFDGMNRKPSVGGGDTSISLTGGFGRVGFATGRGSDYLTGGVAGVAGIGLDDKLFSKLVATDSMSYALPAFGPITVSFSHDEVNTTEALELGIGNGGAGASSPDYVASYQRRNVIALSYSEGAVKANVNYRMFDRVDGALNDGKNNVNNLRAAVSYNLGAAVLGAGFDQRTLVVGSRLDAVAGASIPMGALSFGVQFGQRVTADQKTAANNGTRTSTGLKAAYALSKRTSVSYTWTKFDASINPANASINQLALMSHSF